MPEGAHDDAALAARIAAGDKLAVATALNLIEDQRPAAKERTQRLLAALSLRPGVQRIGLTGPPGVGKSSLASALIAELRARGRSVGVLAVDPSSLRSGGALLGDRARMDVDPADTGAFVRSLATAGAHGGLTHSANAAVAVLSAAYDRVLVETVGVGQSETDVEDVVDTVCVVIQPGSGDVLQFIKAGIMETPDLLIVNKGDQQVLAQRAVADVKKALAGLREAVANERVRGWKVPVLVTSARDRTGIEAFADAVEAHRAAYTDAELAHKRSRGAQRWALSTLARRHGEHAFETLGGRAEVERRVEHEVEGGRGALQIASGLSQEYVAKLLEALTRGRAAPPSKRD